MPRQTWSVYLVRRADGALYCGIAKDVKARLSTHERGLGSKALRGRGPLRLVWSRRIGTRALAQRIEAAIKRLPKVDKERLAVERAFAARWLARQRVVGANNAKRAQPAPMS
jgi:putative endonuclease